MHQRASTALPKTLPWTGLLLLLLAANAGCAREEASGAAAGSGAQEPPAPVAALAVPLPPAPPAPVPAPQASQDRERFRQALARRFDRSRVRTQPASPEGGVLIIPNGRVAHAMVAVRNADGTLSRHCVSSAAEAEALMSSTTAGVEP
jgi:hypothetical protein